MKDDSYRMASGVQTAAKVSDQAQRPQQNQAAVQNHIRSMGQAIVEQAASEKRIAVTSWISLKNNKEL